MKWFVLRRELWLPRSPLSLFPFFADALNLEAITPPWLGFRVLTPGPIEMRAGSRIDYRLRVRGVPMRWQSEITVWDPPHQFTDEQRRGPYRRWIHTHLFRDYGGGTLCTDHVEYALWGGTLLHKLFVQREVTRIFDYRQQVLWARFGEPCPDSQATTA